jgi:hypothetical protein
MIVEEASHNPCAETGLILLVKVTSLKSRHIQDYLWAIIGSLIPTG